MWSESQREISSRWFLACLIENEKLIDWKARWPDWNRKNSGKICNLKFLMYHNKLKYNAFGYHLCLQIVQLRSALDRRATLSFNVQHTHQAAPRNFKHIPIRRSQTSILKDRTVRLQVQLVDLREFFPARHIQIRGLMVAIKRRPMESEENKRRLSQMPEANLIKNVRQSEAVQIGRSQTRACMSE